MSINGKEILEKRNTLGLTKEQFGRSLGEYTRADVAGWEAGVEEIPADVADKIKDVA